MAAEPLADNEPIRLVPISVAAELCSVTPKSIRRWIASGHLPAVRVGPRPAPGHRENRPLRVRMSDVASLLEQVR